MQDQHQNEVRRIPLGLIAAVSAAVLAAGGGAGWFAWNSINSSETKPVPVAPPSPSAQPVQPATEEKVQIYWLNSAGGEIELVPSAIALKNADDKSEILEGAFENLLAGPANQAFTTTIPQGTELRDVSLKADGVHVDLSEEFASGGGSASMTARVAQVLYTASSLDPTAKVWISVDGQPLEVLGGEGLMLDQPLTRENFEENFTL